MLIQQTDRARAEVDPDAGGRIARLAVDGHDLLVGPTDDPMGWGCFAMAPWAGRVRHGRFTWRGQDVQLPLRLPPHAIHGTVLDRRWDVIDDSTIGIDLGPDWPWPGRVEQHHRLTDVALELRLVLTADDEPFPATAGWHPWFRRRIAGVEAEVGIDRGSVRMYRRDVEGIPDGTLVDPSPGPWDDCFTGLDQPPVITWPGLVGLELRSSADHWVIYDEPRHAVCVEPQSGPPDAVTIGGATTVAPDDPLVVDLTVAWPSPPRG